MTLTILNVAYPLAPVGPDAVGGAEQILSALDAALVRAGHRSIVLACEGSRAEGSLIPVPRQRDSLDDAAVNAVHLRHAQALRGLLRQTHVDLVHMHGIDFHCYLPPSGVSVLATLHLPISWYPPHALQPTRPDTWLNCVSVSQHAAAPQSANLLVPIGNGVPVEKFVGRHAKRRFALVLGRICPEKGVHIAIDAVKRAGIPLLIAGEVFAYEAHRRYFEQEVRPRLDSWRRFIGPLGFARKRRLLAAARCLLVPCLAEETSSLVAREALASGTPVIAFDRGAMRETLDHAKTGFLVKDEKSMAEAIGLVDEIDPEACRVVARERFSLHQMTEQYLELYQRLAGVQSSISNSFPVVTAA